MWDARHYTKNPFKGFITTQAYFRVRKFSWNIYILDCNFKDKAQKLNE